MRSNTSNVVEVVTVRSEEMVFTANARRIIDHVHRLGMPAIYESRILPASGGLMSYGPNLGKMIHRAAYYVDKILKGAKPAELPIERPTQFELVINAKTAKELDLSIPSSLFATA